MHRDSFFGYRKNKRNISNPTESNRPPRLPSVQLTSPSRQHGKEKPKASLPPNSSFKKSWPLTVARQERRNQDSHGSNARKEHECAVSFSALAPRLDCRPPVGAQTSVATNFIIPLALTSTTDQRVVPSRSVVRVGAVGPLKSHGINLQLVSVILGWD